MVVRIIRAKLNSSRGVSVLMALLYFLVCVSIGSVVLTAGTATAGRYAELAKSDQRYYGVTSAAKLCRTLIGEETITVRLAETVTVTTSEDGSSETRTTYYSATVSGETGFLNENGPLTEQAAAALWKRVAGDDADTWAKKAWDTSDNGWSGLPVADSDATKCGELQQSLTDSAGSSIQVQVDVNYAIMDNGTISFEVKNNLDPSDAGGRQFKLSFECPVSVTVKHPSDAERELVFTWTPGQITTG